MPATQTAYKLYDRGTISIEGRRESFIIHAGYGYLPGVFPLRDFATIGEPFDAKREGTDDMRSWTVTLIAADRIEATDDVSGVFQTFDPGQVVERPGCEQNAEGAFAAHWREQGHPEFERKDLDDLIAALIDYRTRARP